uniref:RILP-like protein 1 n=1 Tax=Labrus bergylta TaxID=56723 RepID=A0A3Q3F303_9LABR
MEDSGSALEKNVADLTVMDVYDIAAVVGQEFERIIDQYGCEALSRLMPKVVRVLEILEVMVSRNNISPETEELRLELDKLRLERIDRLEKEKKHRKVCHLTSNQLMCTVIFTLLCTSVALFTQFICCTFYLITLIRSLLSAKASSLIQWNAKWSSKKFSQNRL